MTHLHVHSYYSLLAATPSVEDLVQRAVRDCLPALALTDSNTLYGTVTFARMCAAAGICPLIGTMLDVTPPPDLLPVTAHQVPEPLLLLATDPRGWRSLCRLSSALQNHPERIQRLAQGLAWDELTGEVGAGRGLLCVLGGRRSWMQRLIRRGDRPLAHRLAGKVAALFGEANTYLALELHTESDNELAAETAGIGRRLGLPTVAVQPVYILHPDERPQLRLMAAMDANCRRDQIPDAALPDGGDESVDLHWLAPEELATRFAPFPRALAGIEEIVERCGPCLPDGRPIWPRVDLRKYATADAALRAKAQAGLCHRYGEDFGKSAEERLARELAAITGHGYAPLFLLVADLVAFARREEIPVSTRGSVANCLVAFCLGITDVDPVAHDLLFERFLNPARTQLPDIDLDFCSRRRDEVLAYARKRFGEDRVALVATVSTFQPKSALRETAKAYGLPDERIDTLARSVRRGWHPDPRRRRGTGQDELLRGLGDPLARRVVADAFDLVDRPHHLSVHPGGLVVTPGPLTDYVPLQYAPKGFAITQFDHHDVEALGLVKVDLLGIRALTVLAHAAELVQQRHDPDFRLERIPDHDPATAGLLESAETIGVFQCESTGAQRTLRQLKARTSRDLAVANAFFKPGPATGGMADAFVRRYRGEEAAGYLHPSLIPILRLTQGVLLFQEQILRVATEVAGLSWTEAEHLRRGMSKFQPEEMASIQSRFAEGCQRANGPGLTPAQAETLWEQVVAFAGYGFNQGHATAYAAVSYRSAYLKAHWPAEFLCARLAERGGFHHPAVYTAEARRLGIPVRPPHANRSNGRFTLVYEPVAASARNAGRQEANGPMPTLYVGLGQVKGLRRAAVRQMVQARKQAPFADLRDILSRVALRSQEIRRLIRCGALDGLGSSRAALLVEAEALQRAESADQLDFGFWRKEVEPESAARRLEWEMDLLGLPVSVHPLDLAETSGSFPLSELPGRPGRPVDVVGVRLPGWTGGNGFYLDDGRTYVVVELPADSKAPKRWRPLRIRGRWVQDGWGGGWLHAETVEEIGG